MVFSDDFLKALGAWQRGWRENQDQREILSAELKKTSVDLPREFKTVEQPCFRKRFLHKGELVDIIFADEKKEGIVSWTIKREFAERFKGLIKPDAVSGAIFEHYPKKEEVIVNVCALWMSKDFISAADAFKEKDPGSAEPLFHFKNIQGEVVLESSLKGSEIIALTAVSSPFDELCDQAKIPEADRDKLFADLAKQGIYAGELRYTSEQDAQRAIASMMIKMLERIQASKKIKR